MARKAADKGETLPFAVVLGAHPAIQLAACLYLGLGDDEMHCAGALLGEPVRMARCRTSRSCGACRSRIVIEGRIHADKSIVEGLVSEYHGMYEDYGTGVRARFDCMTCRADAMFQVIEPGYHAEHLFLGAVPIAASLKAQLAESILNVGEVAVTAIRLRPDQCRRPDRQSSPGPSAARDGNLLGRGQHRQEHHDRRFRRRPVGSRSRRTGQV